MSDTILDVRNLRVEFGSRGSSVTALRAVSFSLQRGRTLALVGESGSGKSVSSLAIMRLLPGNGTIAGGAITYRSRDGALTQIDRAGRQTMRGLRGAEIAMIFQEPMSSLNPLFPIGDQIGEMLVLHTDLGASARRKRVLEMLELVELPDAATRLGTYPHELSGGMRQRVMIAMALVCGPALLIADEPTTALDVTIQAQILDLMRRLQKELDMSILFITHDMGVVAEMADDVAVMYAGTIVERADAETLFGSTRHPYTAGLLASIPGSGRGERERLVPIPGTVPPLHAIPDGCAFAPRCGRVRDGCEAPVVLRQTGGGHHVACVNPVEVAHA
ncbi:MAG: ABC transporter ATP-binding protein [Rhodobacter sp.]|nr:ABC transporter ATP-binding protein [Rhodobacter sp.]MCY4169544.1 ABC transporter ATP-binding protein [Rhodobacter sp.]MCY4240399.1 ABC transporter ATP-binding protein [Rhodobacter sp.]